MNHGELRAISPEALAAADSKFTELLEGIGNGISSEKLFSEVYHRQLDLFIKFSAVNDTKLRGENGRCFLVGRTALPNLSASRTLHANAANTVYYTDSAKAADDCSSIFEKEFGELVTAEPANFSISFFSYSF